MEMSRLNLLLRRSLFHIHIHRMGSDAFIRIKRNLSSCSFLFVLDFKLMMFYFVSFILPRFARFFLLFTCCLFVLGAILMGH